MSHLKKRIQIAKGFSTKSNEKEAIQELASKINRDDACLTVLFTSSRFNLDYLAKEITNAFNSPVIGCTTAGEITPQGYGTGTISGFSISSKNLKAFPFIIKNLKNLDPKNVENLTNSIKELYTNSQIEFPEGRGFGFLLIDGLALMEEQVTAILGNISTDLPIVGGSAGDDLNLNQTSVFYDGQFFTDTAIFTLFITTLPFTTIKTQHFIASDQRLVITKATPEYRKVQEINGRPAAEEYARINNITLKKLKNMVYSACPLMLKIGGEYFVRSIQKVNDDGSLTFFSAIEEGLVLRTARGENIVENLKNAFTIARKSVPNIKLTIGCDCILRRLEVDDKNLKNEINEIFVDNQVIGFSTYGEQYNSVHVNQTFTGIVIGE